MSGGGVECQRGGVVAQPWAVEGGVSEVSREMVLTEVSDVHSGGTNRKPKAVMMAINSVLDAVLMTKGRIRDPAPAAMLKIACLGNHAEATVGSELVFRTRGQNGPRAYHVHMPYRMHGVHI